MRAEQPTRLFKSRRKMREGLYQTPQKLSPPKAVLIFAVSFVFMFAVVQFLNVLILTLLCVQFI